MAKFICDKCGDKVVEAFYVGDKFLCSRCKPPSILKKDESPWAEPSPLKFRYVEIDKLPANQERNLAYAIDEAKAEKLKERQDLEILKYKLNDVTEKLNNLIERVCELEGERNERIYHGTHK